MHLQCSVTASTHSYATGDHEFGECDGEDLMRIVGAKPQTSNLFLVFEIETPLQIPTTDINFPGSNAVAIAGLEVIGSLELHHASSYLSPNLFGFCLHRTIVLRSCQEMDAISLASFRWACVDRMQVGRTVHYLCGSLVTEL